MPPLRWRGSLIGRKRVSKEDFFWTLVPTFSTADTLRTIHLWKLSNWSNLRLNTSMSALGLLKNDKMPHTHIQTSCSWLRLCIDRHAIGLEGIGYYSDKLELIQILLRQSEQKLALEPTPEIDHLSAQSRSQLTLGIAPLSRQGCCSPLLGLQRFPRAYFYQTQVRS